MATHVWSDAAPGGRESLLVYFRNTARVLTHTASRTPHAPPVKRVMAWGERRGILNIPAPLCLNKLTHRERNK